MKNLTILLALVLCLASYGQNDNTPYNSVNDADKEQVFHDDFSKFSNYWLLGIEEDSWLENIEDGKLFFQSLCEKPKEDVIPIIIDHNRDFEIETSIKLVKGDMDKGYGLQWGKSASPVQQYDFFITGSGQFTIDKYDGEFTDFKPFTVSEHVNRATFNKITVRKLNDTYYFFLNEKLVHTMPFEPFFGNLIGFQVAENSSIMVDYLTISYLGEEQSINSKALIMDYAFEAPENKVKKGIPVTLKLTVKNIGKKDIEALKIVPKFPANIEITENKLEKALMQGSEEILEVQFYATKLFSDSLVKISLTAEGVDISNARDLDLKVKVDNAIEKKVDKNMSQTYSQFRGGSDPLKGLNVAKAMNDIQIGDYYALIIGIDKYSGEWKPLQNAVNDAKAIESTLQQKYVIQHIKALYNEQATRNNILSAFEWLMTTVKAEDNVFIFYSGHGDYNEGLGKGFWVPVDATTSSMTKYVSNEDIKAFLNGIKSKHTLLVADACFSGDIFRGKSLTIPYENSTKYYHKMYSLTSRKAMSSGGLEPVMDGGRDGHSVFSYYFLKSLNGNDQPYYDANQLYNDLKIPVVNNSEQTPEYSPVKNTGDEGGQFMFIKK